MLTTPASDEPQAAPATGPGLVLRGLVALAAAVQFLTRLPPLVSRPCTARAMGDAVAFFPLVGLALGGALAGLDWLLHLALPVSVASALVLLAWVVATGAIHLDGFLDSCDGLLSGRTPEERLRIMRDEHVGAFAVSGGVLLILLKYSSLAAAPDRLSALLIAPVAGRCAMALALVACPYARAEGLGRTMKDHAGPWHAALAAVTALAFSAAVGGWLGLLAWVAAGLATAAVAWFALRRIPGLTGDIYGALCEIVETLVLLLFTVGAGP